jgi:hypothetical protein
MSLSDIAHDASLYFKYRGVVQKGVAAFLKYVDVEGLKSDPDVRTLIDVFPQILSDFAGPRDPATTPHQILVEQGVPPEQAAKFVEALHSIGPQPEGSGPGANV